MERYAFFRTILEKEPGFIEINLKYRHNVLMDMSNRWSNVSQFWTSPEAFAQNYIHWVKSYICNLSTDSPSMWEQWGLMLGELYIGI